MKIGSLANKEFRKHKRSHAEDEERCQRTEKGLRFETVVKREILRPLLTVPVNLELEEHQAHTWARGR